MGTHRLRHRTAEHADRDGVAVERRLAVGAAVRADELEEALEEPRLEESERVLPELHVKASAFVTVRTKCVDKGGVP